MSEEEEIEGTLYMGTVIRYQKERRYGFIRVDDSDNDIFFHDSYLQMSGFKTVDLGARVSFEIGQNHKGPMAVKIHVDDYEENE